MSFSSSRTTYGTRRACDIGAPGDANVPILGAEFAGVKTMKAAFSIMLVLPLLLIGCGDLGVQPSYDMVKFTGTVILESAQTYLIRSDVPYQNTVTFYPLNLAALYRQNGLRIRFSANVEVQPNVMYIALPIRLSSVEILIR